MASLMSAYTNDQRVTREQLAHYATPEARGPHHQPVSFYDFANEVAHSLDNNGLQIIREEHIVGHGGERS